VAGDQRRGHGRGGNGKDEHPGIPGQQAPDAAEQADQRKGADAGDAPPFLLLAFLPAAFEADEQPEGQRDAEARELCCDVDDDGGPPDVGIGPLPKV
jgi:hypothetical protein